MLGGAVWSAPDCDDGPSAAAFNSWSIVAGLQLDRGALRLHLVSVFGLKVEGIRSAGQLIV